jgi:dTDP-glucose 4,6-dehydratase
LVARWAGARDFIEANAQENFDTGIEKTVTWYLENEWWWGPLHKGYDGSRL